MSLCKYSSFHLIFERGCLQWNGFCKTGKIQTKCHWYHHESFFFRALKYYLGQYFQSAIITIFSITNSDQNKCANPITVMILIVLTKWMVFEMVASSKRFFAHVFRGIDRWCSSISQTDIDQDCCWTVESNQLGFKFNIKKWGLIFLHCFSIFSTKYIVFVMNIFTSFYQHFESKPIW